MTGECYGIQNASAVKAPPFFLVSWIMHLISAGACYYPIILKCKIDCAKAFYFIMQLHFPIRLLKQRLLNGFSISTELLAAKLGLLSSSSTGLALLLV